MIFDTDVLIWLMRGKAEAANAISTTPKTHRFISVITYLELIQGVRDKAELNMLKAMLPQIELTMLPLSEEIGQRACELMEQHQLSVGLGVQDALIAATAAIHMETLYTGNFKHFKELGINLKLFFI